MSLGHLNYVIVAIVKYHHLW